MFRFHGWIPSSKKRTKVERLSTNTIGLIKNKPPERLGEKQRFQVLLTLDIMLQWSIYNLLNIGIKKPVQEVKWSTQAGSFKTKRSCNIEFTLPAFHEHRKTACNAYVDESHQDSCNYDMIIGRDLLQSLGINWLFETAEIKWDNDNVHVQPPEVLKEQGFETTEMVY